MQDLPDPTGVFAVGEPIVPGSVWSGRLIKDNRDVSLKVIDYTLGDTDDEVCSRVIGCEGRLCVGILSSWPRLVRAQSPTGTSIVAQAHAWSRACHASSYAI